MLLHREGNFFVANSTGKSNIQKYMAREPFVYREAVPAQQAVQYAQLKSDEKLAFDAGLDDMYKSMASNAVANNANAGRMALSRSDMERMNAQDAEQKNQFEQSLQLEKDRLTAATASQTARDAALKEQDDIENDRQVEMWERIAAEFNVKPPVPGDRRLSGVYIDPKTGKYAPLMKKRRPVVYPTYGDHINDIQANAQRNKALVTPPRSGELNNYPQMPGYTPSVTAARTGELNARRPGYTSNNFPRIPKSDALLAEPYTMPSEYSRTPPVYSNPIVDDPPAGMIDRQFNYVPQSDFLTTDEPPRMRYEAPSEVIPQAEILRLYDMYKRLDQPWKYNLPAY